jgi:antirestriction protein ArdC
MSYAPNSENQDQTAKTKWVPVVRYYRVFNLAQCEGIKDPDIPPASYPGLQPIDAAEKFIGEYPDSPKIVQKGDKAYYVPSEDTIYVPKLNRYKIREEYYSTLYHELVHSTGHEKRLGRKTLTELCPFGSTNYSREELVAEMGAAILCGEAGIENGTIDNSASYIAGWLKRLQDDRGLVVLAAAQAQKAVDLILGRKFEVDQPDDVIVPSEIKT